MLGNSSGVVAPPVIAAGRLGRPPSKVEAWAASGADTCVCIAVNGSTPAPDSRDDCSDFHAALRRRDSSSFIDLNLTMHSVLSFNVFFACETNDLVFALNKSNPLFRKSNR